MESIQSVTIIGRKWFNRGPGNTYHSAQIMVNGRTVHKIDFAYGYGDHYLQSAFEWLEANGYLNIEKYPKSGSCEPPWQVAERLGFHLEYSATDVSRKKDL